MRERGREGREKNKNCAAMHNVWNLNTQIDIHLLALHIYDRILRLTGMPMERVVDGCQTLSILGCRRC